MKTLIIPVLLSSFLIWTSCGRKSQTHSNQNDSSIPKRSAFVNRPNTNFQNINIICDSVYPNKGYRITLSGFGGDITDELKPNTVLEFDKLIKGKYRRVFRDSIYSRMREVKFEDFNNDRVRDILVQNYSDVRSNLTYFLYVVDTVNDRLKKIKGFEEIKEPRYLPKYNLIDNYVTSGRNWTDFYKIKNDTVVDFDIVVEEPLLGKKSTYDRDYKNAIRKIIAIERRNNR